MPADKFDDEKPPMHLLDRAALEETARVLGFGANKYGENNWRDGGKYSLGTKRPLAAALRHIFAYLDGEKIDPESGLSHLGHAMCSVMFALKAELHGWHEDVMVYSGLGSQPMDFDPKKWYRLDPEHPLNHGRTCDPVSGQRMAGCNPNRWKECEAPDA